MYGCKLLENIRHKISICFSVVTFQFLSLLLFKTKEQEKYKHTSCMKEEEGFLLDVFEPLFHVSLLTSSSDRVFVSVGDFHVKIAS